MQTIANRFCHIVRKIVYLLISYSFEHRVDRTTIGAEIDSRIDGA
jgi:hypothetical protein